MSIDINGLRNPLLSGRLDTAEARGDAPNQAPEAAETGKSGTADTVSLSENARQLGKASANPAPVIDTRRVEAMKAAIAEGRYEVNPERVADKLMQFENLMKG